MFLTTRETAYFQSTFNSAIDATRLVYKGSSLFGRLFVLPTVDYLYGNACDWNDLFTRVFRKLSADPKFQEGLDLATDILITVPFLLGVICRQLCDNYVESCLEKPETTGLQGVEADQTPVNTATEEVESSESTGLQDDQPIQDDSEPITANAETPCKQLVSDYSAMGIRELRQLVKGKMPKGGRATKAQILEFLAS